MQVMYYNPIFFTVKRDELTQIASSATCKQK